MIIEMINLPNLTSLNVFLIWLSIFSICLFFISIIYARKNSKKSEEIKEKEENRWDDLELKAHEDYQKIIESASKQANEIILHASEIKQESTNELQESVEIMLADQKKVLEEASAALSKKFEDQLKQVNDSNILLLKNIYKGIESDVESDYSQYKDVIKKQTFEAENIAKEKIKQEYEKLEIEIKEYREKMMNKVNDDIYKILLNISKTVLGKSLDAKDHEDLIIEALNKAKKENII